MSYTVSKLLKIAQAEIGYKEKETNSNLDNKTANAGNENYTKYARDLNKAGYYNGNKNGYDWCDIFFDWCFYQLCGKNSKKAQEMICQTGDCGAGCVFSAEYYKYQNRYYTTPKVGDQVFFGDYEHTGIVEKVSGKTITTIEGNTNNQVKRCTHKVGDGYVRGFGRPKYDAEPKTTTTTKATTTTTTKTATYTVKRGDTMWAIAQKYGVETSVLIELNPKIKNPSKIHIGQKINVPAPKTTLKSITAIAKEVIAGKWGNGNTRKNKLTKAGYDYNAVQKKVNELLS